MEGPFLSPFTYSIARCSVFFNPFSIHPSPLCAVSFIYLEYLCFCLVFPFLFPLCFSFLSRLPLVSHLFPFVYSFLSFSLSHTFVPLFSRLPPTLSFRFFLCFPLHVHSSVPSFICFVIPFLCSFLLSPQLPPCHALIVLSHFLCYIALYCSSPCDLLYT